MKAHIVRSELGRMIEEFPPPSWFAPYCDSLCVQVPPPADRCAIATEKIRGQGRGTLPNGLPPHLLSAGRSRSWLKNVVELHLVDQHVCRPFACFSTEAVPHERYVTERCDGSTRLCNSVQASVRKGITIHVHVAQYVIVCARLVKMYTSPPRTRISQESVQSRLATKEPANRT
jgi:hypothetical protein